MRYLYLLIFLLPSLSLAQGVKGTVFTPEGEVLPYATIYIPALETGSSTNAQGQYEIELGPGQYKLVFQHLGYTAVVREVDIAGDYLAMDVTMTDQLIQLKEVEVNARAEDPAYTIIRKAIAKSKYHRLQVRSYQATVYIKGAGKVKGIPWLLEKAIEDEGIDTSTVFLTESVSEITFEQPNKYTEKVIAIRDIGDQNNTSPVDFINGNFYQAEVAGVISPLSPRAFAYYKFRFMGSFMDRGYEVNKIRVVPRMRGNDVFDGVIYIIDDFWSIHSLDMHTYKQGIKINVEQMYAPIKEKVWMPVSHYIMVDAKIFGVAFEYKYLSTVSNYQMELNPDLEVDNLVIVDEKIEKELAAVLEKEDNTNTRQGLDSTGLFSSDEKMTRKALRKTLRNYENQLRDDDEAPDIVEYRAKNVDSTAYQQDTTYWTAIRPVPLTDVEQQSYKKLDSMAVAEAAEEDEMSEGNQGRNNQGIAKVLFGTTFKISDASSLEYKSPLSEFNYNTVEGYHLALPLVLRTQIGEEQLRISPEIRYAFARNKFIGKVGIDYTYGKHQIAAEGGRYISQFNAQTPISPFINTFTSLLFQQNFLKIYQKDFLTLGWKLKLSDKIQLAAGLDWAERQQLFNNTTHKWRGVEERAYTPNAPINVLLDDTSFPTHHAATLNLAVKVKPLIKYRMRNGKKRIINKNSPEFKLNYRKGTPDLLGSQVNFDMLEVSVKHQFDIGVRGRLDYNVYAGSFLNNETLFFMDFRHFMGNQTVLQAGDPVGSYRLLPYYLYSTQQEYVAAHLYYQFRRFLLTQIFEVQLLGIKENLLLNYLKTDTSPHYLELGYSLDNILRFLRLEAVANFEDGVYRNFGVRIGISTSIEELF